MTESPQPPPPAERSDDGASALERLRKLSSELLLSITSDRQSDTRNWQTCVADLRLLPSDAPLYSIEAGSFGVDSIIFVLELRLGALVDEGLESDERQELEQALRNIVTDPDANQWVANMVRRFLLNKLEARNIPPAPPIQPAPLPVFKVKPPAPRPEPKDPLAGYQPGITMRQLVHEALIQKNAEQPDPDALTAMIRDASTAPDMDERSHQIAEILVTFCTLGDQQGSGLFRDIVYWVNDTQINLSKGQYPSNMDAIVESVQTWYDRMIASHRYSIDAHAALTADDEVAIAYVLIDWLRGQRIALRYNTIMGSEHVHTKFDTLTVVDGPLVRRVGSLLYSIRELLEDPDAHHLSAEQTAALETQQQNWVALRTRAEAKIATQIELALPDVAALTEWLTIEQKEQMPSYTSLDEVFGPLLTKMQDIIDLLTPHQPVGLKVKSAFRTGRNSFWGSFSRLSRKCEELVHAYGYPVEVPEDLYARPGSPSPRDDISDHDLTRVRMSLAQVRELESRLLVLKQEMMALGFHGGDPSKAEVDLYSFSLKKAEEIYQEWEVFLESIRQERQTRQDQPQLVTALNGEDVLPENVDTLYRVALQNTSCLLIDTKPINASQMRGGITVKNTPSGGKSFTLPKGDQFTDFRWKQASLAKSDLLADDSTLANAGYDMEAERAVLHWTSERDSGQFFFSQAKGRPGVISVCSGGTEVIDMDQKITGILRKPVIYLYPTTEQAVTVQIHLTDGNIIAEYPKRKNDGWKVVAQPNGELTDIHTGKQYQYLFWEGKRQRSFSFDQEQAFCVAGNEAEAFLEEKLASFGLNTKERNDFIVYWLPMLEKNPYNLVTFLGQEYTDYAQLTIDPEPDTVIRVFMVFKSITYRKETNPPGTPTFTRQGFTVIEWGGMNLDEGTKTHFIL